MSSLKRSADNALREDRHTNREFAFLLSMAFDVSDAKDVVAATKDAAAAAKLTLATAKDVAAAAKEAADAAKLTLATANNICIMYNVWSNLSR
jgi:hypothetical protein